MRYNIILWNIVRHACWRGLRNTRKAGKYMTRREAREAVFSLLFETEFRSDEETAENIRMLAEHFKGRMFVGAGTVLTEKQVELTAQAGGKFIISPDTCPPVIQKTRELGLVSMPGALTPTEIQAAHKAGADFVKLFPITSFGTGYVKAVKAPLSHIKLLAVGGVDENNMQDYLKAGVSGFGVGSNIIDKKMLDAEDWSGITALAEKYVSVLK